MPSAKSEDLGLFHRTISEQLNSRLTEAPRFFWVVILCITAYAYVLWWYAGEETTPDRFYTIFVVVSILAYFSILWATLYLAALGYAFRYLQNCQHRIEDALGWDVFRPKTTGVPPERITSPSKLFWLLPGIYHAHLYGLIFLSLVLHGIFVVVYHDKWVGSQAAVCTLLFQIGWVWAWNYHYLRRFRQSHIRTCDPIGVPIEHGEKDSAN